MKKNNLYNRIQDFLNEEKTLDDLMAGVDISERKIINKTLRQLDELSGKPCQPDKKRMWAHISRALAARRRQRFIRRWTTVAAILLPALLGGVALLWHEQQTGLQTAEITPALPSHQVQLLLGDGRVVNLQTLKKDSLVSESGAGIYVDTSRSLVYKPIGQEKMDLVFNTLQVPRCCEYRLVLADGTQVWMNSESELRYPVDFSTNERRVYLKGEAYFEVAKNAEKPFRVEANGIVVEALGTGFDINAYGDKGMITATLIEGRVRVSDMNTGKECELMPGKQARLLNGLLETLEVNTEDVIGWTQGRFVFSNMTLEEIATQLVRWYDIRVVFQDNRLRDYRFTGVMKRYRELDNILEFISETTDVKFQVSGGEVLVWQP